MKEQVEEAIKKIRPMLQADGGDVEFVDIEDGVVKVRLQGACAGCPMSQMTVKNGIERLLKQEIPEVKSVESVNSRKYPNHSYRIRLDWKYFDQ